MNFSSNAEERELLRKVIIPSNILFDLCVTHFTIFFPHPFLSKILYVERILSVFVLQEIRLWYRQNLILHHLHVKISFKSYVLILLSAITVGVMSFFMLNSMLPPYEWNKFVETQSFLNGNWKRKIKKFQRNHPFFIQLCVFSVSVSMIRCLSWIVNDE